MYKTFAGILKLDAFFKSLDLFQCQKPAKVRAFLKKLVGDISALVDQLPLFP